MKYKIISNDAIQEHEFKWLVYSIYISGVLKYAESTHSSVTWLGLIISYLSCTLNGDFWVYTVFYNILYFEFDDH